MFIIVRLPCLPEDEGRASLVKTVSSKEEGKAWINAQRDEYFKPGDYALLKDASK